MYIGTSEYDFGHPNIHVGGTIKMLPHLSIGGQFFCDGSHQWSIPSEAVDLEVHPDRDRVVQSFLRYCHNPQQHIPLAIPKIPIKPEYYYMEKQVDSKENWGVEKCANIYAGDCFGCGSSHLYGFIPLSASFQSSDFIFLNRIGHEDFIKCANIYGGISVVVGSSFEVLVGPSASLKVDGSGNIPYYFYRNFIDLLGFGNLAYVAWFYKANLVIANK